MTADRAALRARACGLVAVVVASSWLACACSRKSAMAAGVDGSLGTDGAALDAGALEDPVVTDLWARAVDAGDDDELRRLEARVGDDGLVSASLVPERRRTALAALGFADDFAALPFLATVAATGSDDDAILALGSLARLASAPRRATDPEDALEIREGRTTLLAVARDVARPRARRARVVGVLRLLADRGWVARGEIPLDVDAR